MLGLASSHAPAMFCPPEAWPVVYEGIPDYMRESQPHTAKLETPEVVREHVKRVDAAFDVLRAQLEAYRPDAVIFVGDDQGDLYNRAHLPAFSVFAGDEVWGPTEPYYMGEPPEKSRIHIQVHTELAQAILDGLFERDFDPTAHYEMQPLGRPDVGISHMVTYPHPKLLPNNEVPIVPILINEYFPPMPSAKRCRDLGLALADILAGRPERVAIYASGGLSHDPSGPRAGWVDEPLDRWFLGRLKSGDSDKLTSLFTFDSDTMRGGTGEIRAWIAVAAACARPATIVEYIPSHHAKCGLGFAYWPET